MDIELGLIAKIIEQDDIKSVIGSKITPDFLYGKGKIVYKYMLDHYREYRKTASIEAIKRKFPEFKVEQEFPEPLEYYIDELRERHKYNIINQGLQAIVSKLESNDTKAAETEVYKLASKISTEIKLSRDINYGADIESRIEAYKHKKKHQGIDGIPCGILPIDIITGGAHKGELITILGQPGTGKTWTELVIVRNALKEGYRVLLITKEMEPEQIATRMDAALFELPFDKVRRGMLGDTLEEKYFELLRQAKEKYTNLVISADDGEGTVTDIQAKIEEHNPEFVVIDGSYLIIDEDGGKAQWEQALHVTRRLKRLARKVQMPIYNSTQAGRQVKRSSAPGMEDVGFTYGYSQDSDVIISLYRTPEMEAASKLGVKLTKVREGASGGHFILNWNFDTMEDFGALALDLTNSGPGEDDEAIVY